MQSLLRRNLVRLAAVAACAVAPSGCVTAMMWDELPDRDCGALDWSNGRTVSAVALTPVTVAVDAALIAGFVWLEVEGNSGDCCDCDCGGWFSSWD